MIYILIKDGLIHSVWDNRPDAENQLEKLRQSGSKNELYIEEIAGTIPQNGQYYS
jgi:hypothetical protein